MPTIQTKYFGPMSYEEDSCFVFPAGLPAFEDERAFLPIEVADASPLVFLQSLSQPGLCFVAVPVYVADDGYELAVSPEDLSFIGLAPHSQPRPGQDVLVLALVSSQQGAPPTANLLAPLVINLAQRLGVQAIRNDMRYSHQHVLEAEEVPAC